MQGDLGVWEGVGRRGVRSGEGTGTAGGTLRTRLWRDMGYRALDRLEVLGGLGLAQPPSISAGVVQSIKDHITKPTAMARGRVAHLIEWKGWSVQRAGWELPPAADEEPYCRLPDELREARFAAGQQGRGLGDELAGSGLERPWGTPCVLSGRAQSLQSCPALCDPMDCSPSGSSVHGIFQARILSGLPFPSPGDLSDPGFEPASLMSPALADGVFTTGLSRELQC